jgi:hypothetical protein
MQRDRNMQRSFVRDDQPRRGIVTRPMIMPLTGRGMIDCA